MLATGYAVVAGLAYNYLPFTALPLYVAIERIDKRVLEAAYDLYATRRQAFLRVILPLTVPGIFAAFLLTFIPALGDYINQQILGGTSNTMIGTVIQNAFLVNLDYAGGFGAVGGADGDRAGRHLRLRPPAGLADASRITYERGGDGARGRRDGPGPAEGAAAPRRWTRFILPAYSWLVIAYLVFPIAVMVLYSFNKVTTGLPQVSFAWNGFTTQWYQQWKDIPQLTSAFWLSIRLAIVATLFATVIGTLLALALVRYRPPRFRGRGLVEQIMFLNIAAPEIVLGASLLGLFVTINVARGFVTLLLAHVAFSIAYVTVTVRARMAGFDRTLEEAAADLGANAWVTFRKITFPLIMPGILAGALMAFALSIDDFVTSNFVSGSAVPFPVWVYGATRIGIPPQVFVFGSAIFAVGILCALTSIVVARKQT